MSFAQGFSAGSAAAQRGIDMGLAMKKRREEEAYQEAVAGYNEEYEAGLAADQQALDAYNASVPVQQGAAASGPITSAAGLNPMAQAGIAAPAAPDVQRTVTDVAAPPTGLGDQARGVTTGPAPTIRSESDRLRGLGNLALEYGDRAGAANFFGQARQIDQADENFQRMDRRLDLAENQFGLATDKFEESTRQFNKQQEVRESNAATAAKNAESTASYYGAMINKINATLEDIEEDRTLNRHKIAGENATAGFLRGQTPEQVDGTLRAMYTAEDGTFDQTGYNIASNSAAMKYYKEFMGFDNLGEAAVLTAQSIDPLSKAIRTNSESGVEDEKFLTTYNRVLNDFADPDFSDGIETQLVPAIDPNTGQPSGGYNLMYGDRVEETFANRDEVNEYASLKRDGFMDSPFSLLVFKENEKTALTAKLARAKDQNEREKYFAQWASKNRYMFRNEAATDRIRAGFGLDVPFSTGESETW